jgi:hypothetical protein
MRVTSGGTVVDSEGRTGGNRISGLGPTWVDYSGPVGGGRRAGIAVLTRPHASGVTWFVYDWGTVTVNPFFPEGRLVRISEAVTLDVRLVVHDGDPAAIDLGALYRDYSAETDA